MWDVLVVLALSIVIVPALVTMLIDWLAVAGIVALSTDQLQQLRMAIGVSAQEAALFLLTWGVMRSIGQNLKALGLVWQHPRQDVLWGIGLGVLCVAISPANEYINRLVLGLFVDESTIMHLLSRENMLARELVCGGQPGWLRKYMAGLVMFLAPIAEEVFFRGYVYKVFRGRWGIAGALFLSNLLFAAVHMYVVHFMPVLVLGLLLGLAYEWRKTLITPIVAHGVMNLLVLVAVCYS